MSVLLPAKRASKITPIEAIRQTDDIKIKAKKLKTPKFIRKIFGEEGEIALKNLKRCKKRYRTTVISLVISIVLFITTNGFINYMFTGFDTAYRSVNYDFSTNYRASSVEQETEIERSLISQRTKEALARKRAEGVVLGRPKGTSKFTSLKLYPKRKKIQGMLEEGRSYSYIARKLRVHRITVSKFVHRMQEEDN